MSTKEMTTADIKLRDNVMWQLGWDPEVDAAGIGVTARDATVTLTGYIGSYTGKLAAERAVKQVRGVRAVANDIEVTPAAGRTDTDIADDVAHALRVNQRIPSNVKASVHYGHVSLSGKVEWLYQKEAAEKAVRNIRGVRQVSNYIEVSPKAVARDIQKRIAKALHQNAAVDARHISIDVAEHTATLSGTANSWSERELAERAAAQAAGVTGVDNRIVVNPLVTASDVDTLYDETC
jgi:osmotically-inducible protein OsmY